MALGVALVACGPSSNSPQSGESLYQRKCVICHGQDGAKGASGAPDISKTLLTQSEIETVISEGQGIMPAFGGQMDSVQIDMVANYVLKLKQ